MSLQTYTSDTENVRIDKWLTSVSGLSRTRVQDLCSKGNVLVNGRTVKASYPLQLYDQVEVEVPEGKVSALSVPGPCKLMGLGPSRHDYRIPWDCIRRIGPDIVLVDTKPEECRVRRSGKRLL